MSNIIEYAGYNAKIDFSAEDNLFFGTILGIADLIIFEGNTPNELRNAFREAIDDYIDFCARTGKEPEKTFKGNFNIRISPELHKKSVLCAAKLGISLNEFVALAIDEKVNQKTRKQLSANIDMKRNEPVTLKAAWEDNKTIQFEPFLKEARK
ncbi:MAG: type II toxin-antitoxin system HicB family antitoxin [Christensenellales bacterium]